MSSDSDCVMMESDASEDNFFDSDDASEDDFVVAKPPAAKKSKTSNNVKAAPKAAATKKTAAASAPKKAAAKKMAPVPAPETSRPTVLSPSKNAGNKAMKKTVEQMYQKKTQLEHILLRPDTYIGSVERQSATMFVLNNESDDEQQIIERNVTYSPGLFKIFDEILVNAADNKQRNPDMDRMEITVDAANNVLSVKNNGKGIPVVMHKEHNCYVPTMIFGHLLTGSNFDDNEKKTTGGRNGYGAKLANVFSTEFSVECIDVENGVKFRQVWKRNMHESQEPVIKVLTAAERKVGDYVQITFSPDLSRFGMDQLDDDTVGLLSKRAYDMAGTMAKSNGKKLSVWLNGKKLAIKSFEDYVKLYQGVNPPDAYEKSGRWEVGVSASNEPNMKQISFVNAICTSKGGQHVAYIADQVANHLVKTVKKKNKKGTEIKPAQIKNHLCIFVNCLIDNPAFDSQTKEFMTTRAKAFGSEFTLSPAFLKQLDKSPIVSHIMDYAMFQEKQKLGRKGGTKKIKLTGIPKLDDANFAGTKKSQDCTLIITEGDSAKSLAMAGLSVIGRDYYGVFPLKGKPLNVRDASVQQVLKNEEIKNLVEILGLKFNKPYDASNVNTLRYGHLQIMSDQDVDGAHILGLVINLIDHFWPGLLDVPNFLQRFITPIVKVTKGKKSHSFFTVPEYENWLESTGNNGRGWTQKYYKGLGTSTSAEAKQYFSNLQIHEVKFCQISRDKVTVENVDDELAVALPDLNATSGTELIDMVFRKDRVEDRKNWLNNIASDVFMDYINVPRDGVRYSDFINRELILFSKYDNERSIAHMLDGFKPSQRKVLYACFKRKLKGEIKVAQLTGYVAEQSAYHHGEQSLQGTIVNMAQNYIGSNNINLLTPSGQFGTRRMAGGDAASARYIFTKLEPITRAIFHPDDDDLLTYKHEEGLSIEPEFYMPVIPMVLVNGSEGIGTGWSSNVCNYSPRDIIVNLRRMIAGDEDIVPLAPYYNGFTGTIENNNDRSYNVIGRIERIDDTTLLISELPITGPKKATQAYKTFLESMIVGDGKTPPVLKDMQENHTESTVSFTVSADSAKIDEFEKEGLYKKFKLTSSLSTKNMTLFDPEGKLKQYETPEHIMEAFFNIRLDYYNKRKTMLVEKLQTDQLLLSNKARFVEEVCKGSVVVSNRKRTELLADLHKRGYELFSKDVSSTKDDPEDSDDPDTDGDATDAELAKGFEYLLGMKIWSLTFEKAAKLRLELKEKTEELEALRATAPSQIWLQDLDAIEAAMDVRDADANEAAKIEKKAQAKSKKIRAKQTLLKKRPAKKKDDWDSEMESSSDDDMSAADGIAPAKKPPATQRPAARTITVKPASKAKPTLSSVANKDNPSTKVNTMKATAAAAPKHPASPGNDSEDDFVSQSLMDRMKQKFHVSPPKKSLSAPSNRGPELDAMDAAKFQLASVTPAVKVKSAAAAKKPPPSKPAARPAAKSRARPKAKKEVLEVDSDSDDFDFHSDDDDKEGASLPVAAAGRVRRGAAQRATYKLSDDEDSSPMDDSDSE